MSSVGTLEHLLCLIPLLTATIITLLASLEAFCSIPSFLPQLPQVIHTPHLSMSSKNSPPVSIQALYDHCISILAAAAPQQSTKQDTPQILWDVDLQGGLPGLFLGASFCVDGVRLTLASIFLFLLPPHSCSTLPGPGTSFNLVVHIAHSLKLNYSCWLCLSTRGWESVHPLPLGQWGNFSCNLDSTTTHANAWGPQVTDNKLSNAFSTHNWHFPKGPLFSHIINHLHAICPFSIISQRSEGNPVGSLNPSQYKGASQSHNPLSETSQDSP